jgi:hypothetical protein
LFLILICTLKSYFDKAVFLHTYVYAIQLVKFKSLELFVLESRQDVSVQTVCIFLAFDIMTTCQVQTLRAFNMKREHTL